MTAEEIIKSTVVPILGEFCSWKARCLPESAFEYAVLQTWPANSAADIEMFRATFICMVLCRWYRCHDHVCLAFACRVQGKKPWHNWGALPLVVLMVWS